MANYCNIDQYLYNYLKGCWVDKKFHGVFPSRTWQYNRYIQISTPVNDSSIHYEYRIDNEWNGLVELHIEGRYTQTDYMRFLRYLQKQTETNPDYHGINGENVKDDAVLKLQSIIGRT